MNVLLVDDNEINLDIQKYMLESCDLEVETADNGEKAVELAGKKKYDMIFMDIQMPGIDGFEAAEMIRRIDSSVPIIALSAEKVAYSDEQYRKSGMNGSIAKPLRMDVLNELISSYISGSETETAPANKNSDVIFDGEGFGNLVPDSSSALQIIEQFFSVHQNDCEKLEEHIASSNILAAREIMHDIVGISGNLYCYRLFDISSKLGAQLRQGRSDSLDEFISVWEETLAELREYCNKLSSEGISEKDKINNWPVLWSDFRSLCEEFDVAAVTLFHNNEKLFSENMKASGFEWLRDAVNRYDFLSIIDMEGSYV